MYVQLTGEIVTLIGTYLMDTTECSPQAAVKRMLKIQPELKKHGNMHEMTSIISNLNLNLLS